MAGFVTRELEITYGGLTVGGSEADFILFGGFSATVDAEAGIGRVTWQTWVRASDGTEATFKTNEGDLQAEMRTPDQDLKVTLGNQDLPDWGHNANTGFNARPIARKVENSPWNTGRSALYDCEVTVDLPADLPASRKGRREASIDISATSSGRKTATFSGTWTAVPGTDARNKYEAEVESWADGILTDLGGTWELIARPSASTDQADKLLQFTRIYRERRFNQAQGTLDHPALVEPTLRITRRRNASRGDSHGPTAGFGPEAGQGSSGDTRRPFEIRASYRANIDFEESTNLRKVYEDTIRPFVVKQALDLWGQGSGALMDESPFLDPEENIIGTDMTFMVPDGSLMESLWTERVISNSGVELVPVWNGEKLAKVSLQGPATIEVHRRLATRRLTSGGGGGSTGGGGGASSVNEVFGAEEGGILAGDSELAPFTTTPQDFATLFGGSGEFPETEMGQLDITQPGGGGGGGGSGAGGGGGAFSFGGLPCVVIDTTTTRTPRTIGISPNQIKVIDKLVEVRAECFKPVSQSGGGGGGGEETTGNKGASVPRPQDSGSGGPA